MAAVVTPLLSHSLHVVISDYMSVTTTQSDSMLLIIARATTIVMIPIFDY